MRQDETLILSYRIENPLVSTKRTIHNLSDSQRSCIFDQLCVVLLVNEYENLKIIAVMQLRTAATRVYFMKNSKNLKQNENMVRLPPHPSIEHRRIVNKTKRFFSFFFRGIIYRL